MEAGQAFFNSRKALMTMNRLAMVTAASTPPAMSTIVHAVFMGVLLV